MIYIAGGYLNKPKGCGLLRDALADLKPVVIGLFKFHANMHRQKRAFLREKRRKLAVMKDTKEELRSERKFINRLIS